MNHINDLLSPLHDIVTHKTAGTNITNYFIIKKTYIQLFEFFSNLRRRSRPILLDLQPISIAAEIHIGLLRDRNQMDMRMGHFQVP